MTAGPAPTASVCLLNYGGGRFVDACLAALDRLDPAPLEIIAVDNASPDGSAERLAARSERPGGPPFTLVRSERNLGYAGGHNLGARRARGEYLAFLNVTVEPEPGWLNVLPWLDAHPDVGFAQPAIFHRWDRGRLESLGSIFAPSGRFRVVGRNGRERTDPPPTPYAGEVTSVLGAIFVVRRALFEELGGFDPTMFMYFEETDLCWRGWLRGQRSVAWFDPSAPTRAFHTVHGTHPKGFDARRYFERNRTLSLLRNLERRNLWHLGENLATVASESARRPRFFVRYLREVAEGLPRAAADRHRRQATRTVGDTTLFALRPSPDVPRYFHPPERDEGPPAEPETLRTERP